MASNNVTGSSTNISMEDLDQILQDINDKYARLLIPVIIVFVILMVLGLFGNPLVMYFYGFRLKPTASYKFIVALAVFDLISCLLSMPLEVLDLVYFYTFPNQEACRTLRFVNYFSSIASGTTLIAIATDRFKKICRPFDTQITIQMSKYIILGVMGFALFSSWPSLVFYTVVNMNISDHEGVIARDCRMRVDESYQNYIIAYQGYLLLVFIIVFTALTVIYIKVGKKLYHLRKFEVYSTGRGSNKRPGSAMSEGTKTSVRSVTDDGTSVDDGGFLSRSKNHSATNSRGTEKQIKTSVASTQFSYPDIKHNQNLDGDGNDLSDKKHIVDIKDQASSKADGVKTGSEKDRTPSRVSYAPSVVEGDADKNERNKRKLRAQHINTQRYTVIAISISFAFILSYLPYLILTIWTLFAGYDPYALSNVELIFSELFHRSFLLNSVCNPMIYGLLNSDFKTMMWNVLKRVFCCGKGVKKVTLNNDLSGNSS